MSTGIQLLSDAGLITTQTVSTHSWTFSVGLTSPDVTCLEMRAYVCVAALAKIILFLVKSAERFGAVATLNFLITTSPKYRRRLTDNLYIWETIILGHLGETTSLIKKTFRFRFAHHLYSALHTLYLCFSPFLLYLLQFFFNYCLFHFSFYDYYMHLIFIYIY